ncbi:MAG: MATE family efflux transporter [Clostridia bacterium]|nr:MATE family efflux transporter [Clostridia bacterium]
MSASINRMTEGSIPKIIIKFAIPLFLGHVFQQLYNTVDSLIVGNMIGNSALAAVGSSGSLIFLLIGFFGGISQGMGVVVSQYFGAKNYEKMQVAIHNAMTFNLCAGVFMTLFGTLASPWILELMGTPAEVMPESVEYVQVYFMGSLGMVMYNSCMGVMQAVGDSKHPLYYLIISSILNAILDIVFIGAFHMGVGGAALATIISQFVSVILCLFRLMRTNEVYRVSLKKLGFKFEMLKKLLQFGLPSGFQNSVIALANVFVQSNINSFGEMAMSGCGAYSKIEGFAFLPVTSFTSALTTFVGQNLGAGQVERAKKGSRFGIMCSLLIAELIGVLTVVFADPLIAAFTDETEAIGFGVLKAQTLGFFYFLLAATHCLSAVLRGAGRAKVPMITMMSFWCFFRVAFLYVTVPITQTIDMVNWVYPITWSLSTITLLIYYLKVDWAGQYRAKKT